MISMPGAARDGPGETAARASRETKNSRDEFTDIVFLRKPKFHREPFSSSWQRIEPTAEADPAGTAANAQFPMSILIAARQKGIQELTRLGVGLAVPGRKGDVSVLPWPPGFPAAGHKGLEITYQVN
jgi:hypothetical protein